MLAKELNGRHIGLVVEFGTKVEYSKVELRVRGELRSVAHDGTHEVEVYLTSPSQDTNSSTSYTLGTTDKVGVYLNEGVIL